MTFLNEGTFTHASSAHFWNAETHRATVRHWFIDLIMNFI